MDQFFGFLSRDYNSLIFSEKSCFFFALTLKFPCYKVCVV